MHDINEEMSDTPNLEEEKINVKALTLKGGSTEYKKKYTKYKLKYLRNIGSLKKRNFSVDEDNYDEESKEEYDEYESEAGQIGGHKKLKNNKYYEMKYYKYKAKYIKSKY
jgi:hypothetical protein